MRGLNFEICLVYLDDIIVYSQTIPEHLQRLKEVFERLKRVNLKLKPSKCCLLRSEVAFLGHIVSREGVATDPGKIDTVLNWPTPGNVTDVRSFLGLCSYYRRYVLHFAEIASPLHALTGHDHKFQWTPACQEAFDRLKTALTSAPILSMPNDSGPYTLDTDASLYSIGAVLSQSQGGEERVIAYASRKLSKSEQNYCVTRREFESCWR